MNGKNNEKRKGKRTLTQKEVNALFLYKHPQRRQVKTPETTTDPNGAGPSRLSKSSDNDESIAKRVSSRHKKNYELKTKLNALFHGKEKNLDSIAKRVSIRHKQTKYDEKQNPYRLIRNRHHAFSEYSIPILEDKIKRFTKTLLEILYFLTGGRHLLEGLNKYRFLKDIARYFLKDRYHYTVSHGPINPNITWYENFIWFGLQVNAPVYRAKKNPRPPNFTVVENPMNGTWSFIEKERVVHEEYVKHHDISLRFLVCLSPQPKGSQRSIADLSASISMLFCGHELRFPGLIFQEDFNIFGFAPFTFETHSSFRHLWSNMGPNTLAQISKEIYLWHKLTTENQRRELRRFDPNLEVYSHWGLPTYLRCNHSLNYKEKFPSIKLSQKLLDHECIYGRLKEIRQVLKHLYGIANLRINDLLIDETNVERKKELQEGR
jgi:hypothetical protein